MSIDTDIAQSWAYAPINPQGILPEADLKTYQMKSLGVDMLPTCSRLLDEYRHSMGYYRTARAHAWLFGGLGGIAMLGSCSLLKGPAAGGGIAAGVLLCAASYYSFTTLMPNWMSKAEGERRLFHTMCMEPRPVPVQAPVPADEPQQAARKMALPESVRASLSRPIAIPEIPDSALPSASGFGDRNGAAIAYGAGAAVCAGAAIAIVAFNWTGVVAALDPAIPGLVTASASLGARSAQLFAR